MRCRLRSPFSARRLVDTFFGRDVEMVDILACAERLVQPDRRLVSTVGLNVNHVRVPLSCNPLQLSYQLRRNAAPAVGLADGEVINVDLAPVLLELVQF